VCDLGLSSLGPRIVAAAGMLSGQDTEALTRVIGLSTVGNFAAPLVGSVRVEGLPLVCAVQAILRTVSVAVRVMSPWMPAGTDI